MTDDALERKGRIDQKRRSTAVMLRKERGRMTEGRDKTGFGTRLQAVVVVVVWSQVSARLGPALDGRMGVWSVGIRARRYNKTFRCVH